MIEGERYMPEAPLFKVRICINNRLNTDKLPSCAPRGGRTLAGLLERLLTEQRIPVEIIRGPCMNNCAIGPNIKIQGAQLFNLNGDISDARVDKIAAAIRDEVTRRKSLDESEPNANT